MFVRSTVSSRLNHSGTGSPYVEDVTDQKVEGALASGLSLPSSLGSSCKEFDAAAIVVPTPMLGRPAWSIRAFMHAVREARFALACSTFAYALIPGANRYRLRRHVRDRSGVKFAGRVERCLEEQTRRGTTADGRSIV